MSISDPGVFWDAMYGEQEYRYGTAPNAWVRACAPRLRPSGRVLCIGDGEGRNGVWLAGQAFDVTTIDASAAGVAKARALAASRGVSPTVLHGRFPDDLPTSAAGFDAIVLTFIHAPAVRRPALHAAVVRLLGPGGVVVLDAFTKDQLGRASGGPPDEDMLFTAELLRGDFADLRIEDLEEYEAVLDEGHGHAGPASLVRLFAVSDGPR